MINAVKAQVAPQLTTGGHPALAARVEALLRHQGAGVDTGKIARTIVKQQIGGNAASRPWSSAHCGRRS